MYRALVEADPKATDNFPDEEVPERMPHSGVKAKAVKVEWKVSVDSAWPGFVFSHDVRGMKVNVRQDTEGIKCYYIWIFNTSIHNDQMGKDREVLFN